MFCANKQVDLDALDCLVWAECPQRSKRRAVRLCRIAGHGTIIRALFGCGIALLIVAALTFGAPRNNSTAAAQPLPAITPSTPTRVSNSASLAQWEWPTAIPTPLPPTATPPGAIVLDLPPVEWQLPLHGNGIYFTQGYGPGHRGWDIVGPIGSAVYAVASGQVVYANWSDIGYGYLVVVDHTDGLQTLYAHLQSFAVGEGWTVYPDTALGVMGGTGNAVGWHLHFEVRLNGTPVDPAGYLRLR